jgi:hypothetical protein
VPHIRLDDQRRYVAHAFRKANRRQFGRLGFPLGQLGADVGDNGFLSQRLGNRLERRNHFGCLGQQVDPESMFRVEELAFAFVHLVAAELHDDIETVDKERAAAGASRHHFALRQIGTSFNVARLALLPFAGRPVLNSSKRPPFVKYQHPANGFALEARFGDKTFAGSKFHQGMQH